MQLPTAFISLVAIAAGIQGRALQERRDLGLLGIFKTFPEAGCGRDYGIEAVYSAKVGKCQKFTEACRAVQLMQVQSTFCSFNVFDNDNCDGDGYGTTTNMCINVKEGSLKGFGSWVMNCPV
ncbi:hypothetical protein F4779DRAFT_465497 [Xylariaceae sp. FL0662B]|nr:hypothetical protein F4779DRAFT_465497 [Xylariaceae sp. FL0662B]